jgi:clan AA aspartic protease (TIGR02281 family)
MTKSTFGYTIGLIVFFMLGALLGYGIAMQPALFSFDPVVPLAPKGDINVASDTINHQQPTQAARLGLKSPFGLVQVDAERQAEPTMSAFSRLISQAQVYDKANQYELGFEFLLQASYEITNIAEQDVFEEILARFVEGYRRSLIQTGQLAKLDQIYETIAMQMPNLSAYQLLLGKLRMRMGNPQAALLPLSQISNHPTLGAEARRLIADIENRAESTQDNQLGETQEVELKMLADQYVVTIVINDRMKIPVLIDTGAAVTILEPQVLRALGYNLAGPSEYFATANGVVEAPMVWVDALAIGTSRLQGVAIGGLALGLDKDVRGLLGMNVLRHFDFKIDQNQRLLILSDR